MMKRATILLLSLFFAFIVLLIFTVQEWQREEQAEWMPKVEFQGDALSDAEENAIKEAVMSEIIPYKLEYDHINISVKKNNGYYEIEVFCFSDECEYPDVYDFSYDGNLILNGYILEAIPPAERAKAISVALQNEEVANLVFAKGLEEETPSVRRILPETAVKFYAAKTMLSVTWTKLGKRPSVVSALIDPDVWKVVQVWNC